MPTPLLEKPEADRDEGVNPGDEHFDDIINRNFSASEQERLGKEASAMDTMGGNADSLADGVRDLEGSPGGGWATNVTGAEAAPASFAAKATDLAKKAQLVLKKRGAIIGLVTLLGGGAAIPFLGATSLPFSILGNMDMKSLMHGLQQYSEDFYGYKIFGGKKTTVDSNGDKLRGLRDTEIEQLKKQGVTLEGGKKTKSGKYIFDSVRFKDGPKISAAEFRTEMVRNPAFRRAMVIDKGSYFKSAKSAAAKKVWGIFKYPVNPDLKGDTPEEKNKKLYAAAVEETTTDFRAPVQEEKDKEGKVTNADQQKEARDRIGTMTEDVDRIKTEIADGKISQDVINKSNMGNIGYLMSQDPIDVMDAGKSAGGKVWSFFNSLDALDAVCSIYQVAQTANALARTVALVNTVRFAMTIRSALERAKAGEDDGSVNYLMNLIMQKDPVTGQSFDSSSYAAMLFTGQLSSEPSAVSATGGRAMLAIYSTMLTLHTVIGSLIPDAIMPSGMSPARQGRYFMREGCGLVQNLGVQIGVTVASFVLGFFTGGASKVAEGAAKTAITKVLKEGIKWIIKDVQEKLIKKFGKEAIERALKKKAADFAEQGVLKTMAKDSWKIFKGINSSLDGWAKFGILLAAVSTFGMGYIVQALAGGNIAGYIKNGFAAFDGLGTGWQMYEFSNAIGSGGSAATYAQAMAYEKTLKQYQSAYIEDQRYLAKDTPLDITNPYSTIGMAANSVQRTLGAASFKNPLTFFQSLATLPFRMPGTSIASAIGEAPTPEQIGAEVGNQFYTDSKIALQVMGSPTVIFSKKYTFEDIMTKLVDVEKPQIRYDGDDPTSGEPKMTVIENSDLANYQKMCHNPTRTELDPQFGVEGEDGPDSNLYDIDMCIAGGSKYDKEKYPLYDDALRFVNQVNPSAIMSKDNVTGGGEFTVASYNILGFDNWGPKGKDISGCTAAANSKECLKLRSDYQFQIIKGQAGNPAFDVFGTQETSPEQYDYYKSNLSGYAVFPEDTSRMTQQEDGRTAIWWNSSKFTKVASGKAPGVSNVVKGSLPNVTVPWVELQDAKGNKVFVMSIHYPISEYGGTADVIKKASQYTIDWAKTKVSATTPVVVVGDFNDKPEQKLSYCTYTKGGIMQHAKDMQDGAPNKECPNPDKINGIDHIYISTEGGLTASNWTHMANEGVVSKASDHQPVYAKLTYPGSQTAGGVAWVLDRKYYDDPATHAGFMKGHGYSGGSFYGADNSVDISFNGILGLPVYAMVGGNVTKRPLPRSSQKCVGTPNPSNNGGLEITSKVPGGTLKVSYAHGNDVTTKSTVNTGEQIMTVGNVGNSCGAHLHMDIDYNGKPICPNDIFLDLAANKNIDYNDLAGRATAQCTGRG